MKIPMQMGGVLAESKYKAYSPAKVFAATSDTLVIESFDVSKTGYTPIGVVGVHFWGTANQQIVIDTFNISGNNVEIAYRHIPNTTYCEVSRVFAEILYTKS